ncbi:hypothetical protein H5V45_03965 [Nocardioides sp. KIGAM211]|uniref:Uncharacterized protein n=1 Tax=Nocardioides luti TaxID=2761101 RepID=A0A7X0VAU1_9ACTN|nr:hypothetical protein [Nocardioides luti]MBB6626473.1 hypothetical protein [Nocardioides luti]
MSPTDLGTLVLVLLAAAVVAGAWGWTRAGAWIWAPVTAVALAAAAVVAAVPDRVDLDGRALVALLVVLAGTLAVVGGGPVTTRVFDLVDGQEHTRPDDTLDHAGEVLRGGAWIGALERAAVFASLAVGQPEGVAIVLALKGLGRYPELRNGEVAGAAERFIIGTFTSVLWAAACAGVVRLLV